MFTGIIETIGLVRAIEKEQKNVHFTIESTLTPELKIDQSVAHNGVCLTVVNVNGNEYTVTAIKETLDKSNLQDLNIGSKVNLERCMPANGRFDGHIVQGHVDETANCLSVSEEGGSHIFEFECASPNPLIVDKGSITINGISLTIVKVIGNIFTAAIIPYTFEHTNLGTLQPGDQVNIEFDIVGKYIAKLSGQLN